MKDQHWIFSFSSVDTICQQEECNQSEERPVSGRHHLNLTKFFRSHLRGLHPICDNNGMFIGHA